MHFLEITDDLLLYICSFLDVIDLSSFESVCRRTRRVAAHLAGCSAYRQVIVSRMTEGADEVVFSCMRDLVEQMVHDITHEEGYSTEKIEKRLAYLLQPDQKTRLKVHPLAASSYDSPEEHLGRVLSPVVRTTSMLSYWSSSGSDDPDSMESVSFTLYPCVTLITRISIRPFSAWFQQGRPIYPPQKVQFTIGGVPLYHGVNTLVPPEIAISRVFEDFNRELDDQAFFISLLTTLQTPCEYESDVSYTDDTVLEIDERPSTVSTDVPGWCPRRMRFTTDQFPVEPVDQVQHFDLPTPALCINGYLKIDLLGKVTRQEADMKYYTCLGYVACEGFAIHGVSWKQREFRFEKVPYKDVHDPPSDSESEFFHGITNDARDIERM